MGIQRRAAGRAGTVAIVAAMLAAATGSAGAQTPYDPTGAPRTRLRDPARNAQTGQKLDDALRKLKAEDLETRLEGLRALGEVNDAKATDYLIGAANDPEQAIRAKAIDTLGHIKAKDATPLLVQRLFMRDTDEATKRRILASLGKIGDPRATGPILDVLARDLDPRLRGNAIFALGDIGDPKALPALEALAKNEPDPMLRGLAAEAVRKIRERPEPAVVPPALAVDRRQQPPAATP
jgi:HEAT repeat protein